MRILALDTSTKIFCLGVYDAGKVYEYHLEAGTRMSSLTADTVRRVLEALRLRPGDIDYFACGIGPGSFTGVRIGVSTIKGLAWALNRKAAAVSTLDILAEDVHTDNVTVVPVIDARRDLFYCGVYKRAGGELKRLRRHMLLSQEELARVIPRGSVIMGDALKTHKDFFARSVRGAVFSDSGSWYPKAHNLITLALRQIDEKNVCSSFELEPLYLFPKECQIRR